MSTARTGIVIVHRDPSFRQILSRILEGEGSHVSGAPTLGEVAPLLATARVLVISQNSFENLASEVAALGVLQSELSVLVLVSDPETVAIALQHGAADAMLDRGTESMPELIARVTRMVPRHSPADSGILIHQFFDFAIDAWIALDAQDKIILFNKAAVRLVGSAETDTIGRPLHSIFPTSIAERVLLLLDSDAYGGQGRLAEYRTDVVRTTGERVPVVVSAARIAVDGRRVGTSVMLIDLRERVRMERRLEQAQDEMHSREKQALISELAGAAAHELNQPLTTVMGYAEFLRRKVDSSLAQPVEIILSEAERMAEIIRRIGRITRYETMSYAGSTRIVDLERSARTDETHSSDPQAAAYPPNPQ